MQKEFFKTPTLAGIVRNSEPVYTSRPYLFPERVMGLQDGQYLVVKARLIPPRYRNARKFLKHGEFVKVATPESIDSAVEGHLSPWKMRGTAFDSARGIYHPGYAVEPFKDYKNDRRVRTIRLVELCEGLRILCYGHQEGAEVVIKKKYDDSERASKDGAVVYASVPSRREKEPRYDFRMRSVVLDMNDPSSFAAANNFATDISFPAKSWDFRFNYYDSKEDSDTLGMYAPEIAAYYKLVHNELHTKKPNIAPLEMSIFGFPTKLTTDFYKRLISCVVMYDLSSSNPEKIRKLNKAEQEIMLWALVNEMGYNSTFFRKKEDGPLMDVNWKLL